jgi:hypothetical protein
MQEKCSARRLPRHYQRQRQAPLATWPAVVQEVWRGQVQNSSAVLPPYYNRSQGAERWAGRE